MKANTPGGKKEKHLLHTGDHGFFRKVAARV